MPKSLYADDNDESRDCHHHESESRLKIDSMGRYQIALQCVDCGKRMSKDISAQKFSHSQLEAMPKWDLELEQRFNSTYQSTARNRLINYEEYLLSDKWKALRDKVLARANMVCEGCGDQPATRVNHLTFKRFGDEMLFDLVAICDDCRDKLHARLAPSDPKKEWS